MVFDRKFIEANSISFFMATLLYIFAFVWSWKSNYYNEPTEKIWKKKQNTKKENETGDSTFQNGVRLNSIICSDLNCIWYQYMNNYKKFKKKN